MDITTLAPLQDHLRLSADEINNMVAFVKQDGFFNIQSITKHKPNAHHLIALCQIEDRLFIRDGTHRVCTIAYAGRTILREDEYFIEHKTVEEFLSLNIPIGWVTPFHPFKEVRRCNFFDYKNEFMALAKTGVSMEELVQFAQANHDRYAVERTTFTIDSLVEELEKKLLSKTLS